MLENNGKRKFVPKTQRWQHFNYSTINAAKSVLNVFFWELLSNIDWQTNIQKSFENFKSINCFISKGVQKNCSENDKTIFLVHKRFSTLFWSLRKKRHRFCIYGSGSTYFTEKKTKKWKFSWIFRNGKVLHWEQFNWTFWIFIRWKWIFCY